MALGLASCAPATPPPTAPQVLHRITLAQADAIIVSAGGRITSTEPTNEDGFLIEAVYPGGMPLSFELMDCEGSGDAKACPEYELKIAFEAKDVEAARKFDEARQVNFPADGHDGDKYEIWRMGFTFGGVTRTYLRNELRELLDIGWSVAETFPFKDKAARPPGPKPSDSEYLDE
jgi:hypothetical protein